MGTDINTKKKAKRWFLRPPATLNAVLMLDVLILIPVRPGVTSYDREKCCLFFHLIWFCIIIHKNTAHTLHSDLIGSTNMTMKVQRTVQIRSYYLNKNPCVWILELTIQPNLLLWVQMWFTIYIGKWWASPGKHGDQRFFIVIMQYNECMISWILDTWL